MRRPNPCPRVALVEGKDEQFTLSEVLEANGLTWPSKVPPVWLEQADGVDQLLTPGLIEAEWKASGLEALGIIVDADNDRDARWQKVRSRLLALASDVPEELCPEGLILEAAGRPRLGCWVMPDNVSQGMLETLLLSIRSGDPALHALAAASVNEAKSKGAPYKASHQDKAHVHTWLAWQDPPGQQLHLAVKTHALDATREQLRPFVAWFRRLFGV
jgi:hypothetical protein